MASLRSCDWHCLRYFSQVCKVSFLFGTYINLTVEPLCWKSHAYIQKMQVHIRSIFLKKIPLSLCAWVFICEGLAVWQRHVQHMLHVQTLWYPIGNSCSEIPLLWSREVCKQLDLTRRAFGQQRFHTSTRICPFGSHWMLFPCTVKRWANLTQRVLLSKHHLSFCNHLNTGIYPSELQMLYSSKQKLFLSCSSLEDQWSLQVRCGSGSQIIVPLVYRKTPSWSPHIANCGCKVYLTRWTQVRQCKPHLGSFLWLEPYKRLKVKMKFYCAYGFIPFKIAPLTLPSSQRNLKKKQATDGPGYLYIW